MQKVSSVQVTSRKKRVLRPTVLSLDEEEEEEENSETSKPSPEKLNMVIAGQKKSRIIGEEGDMNVVCLNVGGTRFFTTLNTLQRDRNSMLCKLFSGKFKLSTLPCDRAVASRSCFIDRSPQMFEYVLDYLRNGPIFTPPATAEKRRKLFVEAMYYCLDGLVRLLRAPVKKRFEHKFDGDSNGVFYYLGTGEIEGPISKMNCPLSLYCARVSEEFPKKPFRFFELSSCDAVHSADGAWVRFDFGKRKVHMNAYTLRYGDCYGLGGSWDMEGSNDMKIWANLHSVRNDTFLNCEHPRFPAKFHVPLNPSSITNMKRLKAIHRRAMLCSHTFKIPKPNPATTAIFGSRSPRAP
eukprot:jgi/Bigna1/139489/aug1.50_g14197